MAGEKRTKPCGNCKKSKTKCEYTETLPCTRCLSLGQAASCRFVVKLPSIGLPPVDASPVHTLYNQAPASTSMVSTQLKKIYPQSAPAPHIMNSLHANPREDAIDAKSDWKAAMEDKLLSMDTKFNDLLMVLKNNQQALMNERELTRKYIAHNQALYETLHQREIDNGPMRAQNLDQSRHQHSFPDMSASRKRASSSDSESSRAKSMRSDDFRGTLLSLQDAKLLFQFFDTNISQQLFGFEIKQFSVDSLWDSSPLLICAVCTIACMHYPDPRLSSKQNDLHRHLHELCSGLLFRTKPRTETEGFNTIVALVLCSFWLSDSQMFTGLALQLAKDFRITHSRKKTKSGNGLSDKDRLKLWYLLYILDGQQSMTFNRQALVSSDDYNVVNSKKILLEPESDGEQSHNEAGILTTNAAKDSFTDLRLVSQVEYNAALNESLKGNAWELLTPAEFGIPSRSNLELDKWMVSWTVLLAPTNNGSVWSSKSTLIYYNFAKMYINSSTVRRLQGGSDGSSIILPNWNNCQVTNPPASTPVRPALSLEHDSDDSDEEDEEPQNQLQAHDQESLNLHTAMNAAQTVLNLVLNDSDISNNLKYVPVHIHIMLYYAAILLVSSPLNDASSSSQAKDAIGKLRTVKLLSRKISGNLPTDRDFGRRLLGKLDQLFEERIEKLKSEIDSAGKGNPTWEELSKEIHDVQYASSALEFQSGTSENSSREVSPKPEKIYAWPGSHHGHP